MNKDEILVELQKEAEGYNKLFATDKNDWIIKGLIDVYRNIYTISIDTKVVSKVIEILLIPSLQEFATRNDLTLELSPQQNFYPDITFISNKSGERFAVDIKSTFKDADGKIKSMTLGAFTGYFRNRESTKNILYPYGSYSSHLVLGVIYSQNPKQNDKEIYSLDELENIESVIKDFIFFVQPKYKIASASPGSGNTKNIGSINNLDNLIKGEGFFAALGEEVYDDYWMYYLTNDMAKTLDVPRPYKDLKTYLEYKQRGIDVLNEHHEEIEKLGEEEVNKELEEAEDE